MSTAGRKPMPDQWKRMTGNAGRRPIENSDGMQVPPGIPAAPAHISPIARAEWDRITEKLYALGLICEIDMAVLAMYCQSYGRWVLAEQKMAAMSAASEASGGLLVKTPNGYPQISPWLVIANKAMEQCHKYAGEFGLSPAARARVKAMALQGNLFPESDPLTTFLEASKKLST